MKRRLYHKYVENVTNVIMKPTVLPMRFKDHIVMGYLYFEGHKCLQMRGTEANAILWNKEHRLEDLTVLKRSPDLLNDVKIGHIMKHILFYGGCSHRLEDLTVLKRSPDLLNDAKIGHIMKHILFYGGCSLFGQVT